MKKVISLALCLMMLCSLFAVNVNAMVPVQNTMEALHVLQNADGDINSFPGGTIASTGATATTIDDGSNKVLEFALNETGAWASGKYVFNTYSNAISTWYAPNFEMVTDVKPINNTTGISFSIKTPNAFIHVFPASLTTGEWSTVRILCESNVLSVYVKAQGADDSTYKKLINGEGYKCNLGGAASTGNSFFGLDIRFMDTTKMDSANAMSAKYYFDNIILNRFTNFTAYNSNILYTDDVEIVFDTTLGATGYEYALPADISLSSSSLTIVFDAVRNGGERPVHMRFGNASGGRAYSLNIFSGETGVEYTYKADYKLGSLVSVSRKQVGTDTWVTLEYGTDYSASSIYGASRSFKFGYLGEWCGDDTTKLTDYCGGKPAIADTNTKWTFSNLQVSAGYTAGVSAAVNAAKTQATVSVVAPIEFDTVTPIVAVYEGSVLKAVETAEIDREGQAVIDLNHSVADPTIKLFVWDSLANGKPALTSVLDITANVK